MKINNEYSKNGNIEKYLKHFLTIRDLLIFISKVQERLYNEQVEIFGENGYMDDATQNHLSQMKYLEACIKVTF